MSDQPEPPNSRSSSLKFALWLPTILILYVSSIGPVIKLGLALHNPGVDEAIGIFYAPLGLLVQVSPAADRAFEWYIRKVWGIK